MKLTHYSKEELKHMHMMGYIDLCPICWHYHVNENKPKWPMANMSLCEDCKKEKEGKKRGI